MQSDSLILGGKEFQSRFILGSGKYSHELIDSAINEAGAQILTLALRRINESKERNILDFIPKGVTLLPNTSGARNAKEAVRIAQLARELGCGELVKIEIITDSKFLFPDNTETIKACEAMEMGAAAIMANTAIASSKNIPLMARAFKEAIIAGRNAYLAGLGAKSKSANASSPLTGFLD